MVGRVDACVGDVLQTLADLDLLDSTMVVLTSDNGPHKEAYTKGIGYNASEFDSFGPFDGIKRDAWEGGSAFPTLVLWPGHVPAGHVDRMPSQFHDWMPTFCEAAGVGAPARTDGVSLLPRWSAPFRGPESTVYVEYAGGGKSPNYGEFDVSHRGRRRGQEQVVFLDGYKGIRVDVKSHEAPFEIYDVEADPRESDDLAGTSASFRELERRMRAKVLRLRRPNPSAPRPYDDAQIPALAEGAGAARRPGVIVASYRGDRPYLTAPPTGGLGAGRIASTLSPESLLTPPGGERGCRTVSW